MGFQRLVDRHLRLAGATVYAIVRLCASGNYRLSRRRFPRPEVCFVLGNGPSLTRALSPELIDRLATSTTVCVNFFPITEEYAQVQPDHLVLLDPGLWQDVSRPEALEGRVDELFTEIERTTKWPLTMHVPKGARRSEFWEQKSQQLGPNVEVNYYAATPVAGYRRFRHAVYRLGLGIPPAANVLVPAVFLAVNSGYSEIYTLGADHDMYRMLEVGDDNTPTIVQGHFYDEQQTRTPLYDPGFGRVLTMAETFGAWSRTSQAYEYLDEYAAENELSIVNATPGSAIDAFRKINGETHAW